MMNISGGRAARRRTKSFTLNVGEPVSIVDDLLDRALGERVNREISPHDEMFSNSIDHYFGVGRSALRCVMLAMWAAGKNGFTNILDLPCGHGRVLRALGAAFPQAELTGCDIAHDGVDFCAKMFGARPVYSNGEADPALFDWKFDLIWCGSLLTHLDAPRWSEFLKLFAVFFPRMGFWCSRRAGTWSPG